MVRQSGEEPGPLCPLSKSLQCADMSTQVPSAPTPLAPQILSAFQFGHAPGPYSRT